MLQEDKLKLVNFICLVDYMNNIGGPNNKVNSQFRCCDTHDSQLERLVNQNDKVFDQVLDKCNS